MVLEYKLSIYKDAKPILFRYIETHYPLMDTEVVIYEAYKLNIMLSDGLAAVLDERGDVYNTFSGDLLLFSPPDMHHGRILRQGTHKYVEFLIPTEYFQGDLSYTSLFCDEKRTVLLSPSLSQRQEIISIADKVISGIKDSPSQDDVELFLLFLKILKICNIVRCEKGSAKVPAVLDNAIDFIKKEYSENIGISDIANAVKCSSSYLSRIFKKHVGKSPYTYLTEYRLFVAEKLLRNGASVTDTAFTTGFCDSSVFIKCFKKSFGITPLKYKKKYEE